MTRLFSRLSLRKNLFILVSFMVLSLASSMAIALFVIQKVQIGGMMYSGIEMKTEFTDMLARLRVNATLLNMSLHQFLDEGYSPDGREHLEQLQNAQEKILSELSEGLGGSTPAQDSLCGKCHSLDYSQEFETSMQRVLESNKNIKQLVSGHFFESLKAGKKDEAHSVLAEDYQDQYLALMESSRDMVRDFRESAQSIKKHALEEVSWWSRLFIAGGLLSILAVVALAGFFVEMIVRNVKLYVEDLQSSMSLIAEDAENSSDSAKSNAGMSTELAAALEEQAASLEEISAMTKSNAENTGHALTFMQQNQAVTNQAGQDIERMRTGMERIRDDSTRITSIIEEIEAIAFQTNILALNAAVEAARAGEHGAGFAVVADEVRNLAQRTTSSADSSKSLIDQTVRHVNEGMKLAGDISSIFDKLRESATQLEHLLREISNASMEQTEGVSQIDKAVSMMSDGVQQLAANTEEVAAGSADIKTQVNRVLIAVQNLSRLIMGESHAIASEEKNTDLAAPAPRSGSHDHRPARAAVPGLEHGVRRAGSGERGLRQVPPAAGGPLHRGRRTS